MKDHLHEYLCKLKVSQGVDLPKIAIECGMNFARDIYPAIQTDPEFREGLQNYLHELVYGLIDAVLVGARTGKGKVVDVPAAKEAIRFIQSGVVLGGVVEPKDAPLEGEAADIADDLLASLACPAKPADSDPKPS